MTYAVRRKVFPAWAGMNLACTFTGATRWGIPRMSGGEPKRELIYWQYEQYSPHERG